MGRLFQPLLFLLAQCARNELIRQIEFLQAENEMLRSRVPKKHVVLKPAERDRLLKLGAAIGPKLKHIITIVGYSTFLRWKRDKQQNKPAKTMGRPKTPSEVRELILKLARETAWGYTRIMGELKKLGITPPSKATVQNILRSAGHDPGPQRGQGSWEEFLKMHAETLWQCDFFRKRVLTKTGFRQVFALVFINVATRRVVVSSGTFKLGDDWVQRQTESFFHQVDSLGMEAKLIMRDNDSNYVHGFDQVVIDHGAAVRRTAVRAPNENAFVERFVQTIKQECLDHFLVFGDKHFDYLVREFVQYYHECRPHQGIENRMIGASQFSESRSVEPLDDVRCETRLGGLLKHYYRAAA